MEIDEGEMMRLLMEACPALGLAVLDLLQQHGDDPNASLDLVFHAFSDLLVDMLISGDYESLHRALDAVERLNRDGNEAVQRHATLSILEELQQVYTPSGGGISEAFVPHLGPISSERWARLAELRAGTITERELFD